MAAQVSVSSVTAPYDRGCDSALLNMAVIDVDHTFSQFSMHCYYFLVTDNASNMVRAIVDGGFVHMAH